MISKVQEKQRAIELRRRGYSYKEIIKKVNVAKSSLSLWLRDLPLTKEEQNYLKTRKKLNMSRGRIKAATSIRNNKTQREASYLDEAKKDFNQLKSDSLFLVGIALYWAEGNKRNDSCALINSDPEMLKVFIKWLKLIGIQLEDLDYRLYIHKHYANEQCEKYWAKKLNISPDLIKISYKVDNKQIKKRPNYKGCLRIRVKKSTKLLFMLRVWQNMLVKEYMRP